MMMVGAPDPDIDRGFQAELQRFAGYRVPLALVESRANIGPLVEASLRELSAFNRREADASLRYLDALSEDELCQRFEEVGQSPYILSVMLDPPDEEGRIESTGFALRTIAAWWLEEYRRYQSDQNGNKERQRRERRAEAARGELMAVHSSMPVYDIGETIARGMFQVMQGEVFPSAPILGDTKGKLELVPFWDPASQRSITPQRIGFIQQTNEAEFLKFKEQAIEIATGYNEEMATYFYAMDAYWLNHAKDGDDYVELRIEDLLQYTGKKPVKAAGRYTGAYRPDQICRAGQMVFGLGFTMVEIERTVIRGRGTRTHYKRLWEVEDAFSMQTLDGETWLESIRYRPCEIFRSATFGTRRETALLMSRILALDFDKMVLARRLGRYYTWLWRDRAYNGDMDAPITCETLLSRAGIEVVPGKEHSARRSLETALDRLESEGIITQWLLIERDGSPADTGKRIPFAVWRALRVAVKPPPAIQEHYRARFGDYTPPTVGGGGEPPQGDMDRFREMAAQSGKGLRELAGEIGIDAGTLSRILSGKTRRPRGHAMEKIRGWMG